MARSTACHCALQFTHPVWGATKETLEMLLSSYVSIHAPRVGCDTRDGLFELEQEVFQFTHPVWGATPHRRERRHGVCVSIHAPRVGCDRWLVRRLVSL